MSLFAFRDAYASLRNINFLRRRCRTFHEEKERIGGRKGIRESGDNENDKEYQRSETPGDITVLLDVCHR